MEQEPQPRATSGNADNRARVANEFSGRAHAVVQAEKIDQVHFHLTNTAVDLGGAPRTIAEWNPFDLGIHRSMAVSQSPGPEIPVLPDYFRRRHDEELDDALSNPQRSVAIILVGSSSTGKTRALHDAIYRHEPVRQWPLTYPQDARSLDRAFDAELVAPRTVLWLNETQEHFSGEYGESAAARLRALVNGTTTGPVVVVGTLWPEHWDALTAEPRNGRDPHHHARQLLLHQVRRIRVPDQFTPAEISELDSGGTTDPRLLSAAGMSMSKRKVIQILAGGPLLIERYEYPRTAAERYAAAVVAAAVDARQLGHHNPLPHELLRYAAPAYLTDDDRVDLPDGWFTLGLTCATKDTVHGVTALLPRRTQPGSGAADAYELHDYLDQHGRVGADARNIPAMMWEALISHARTSDDLLRAAKRASSKLQYHYAEPLHRRSVEAGATRHPRELKEIVLKRSQLDKWRDIVAAGISPEHRADQSYLDRIFHQRVIDKLDSLSARQRAVFVLRYFESLSISEIAATLGMKNTAVIKRIASARTVLRTELLATDN